MPKSNYKTNSTKENFTPTVEYVSENIENIYNDYVKGFKLSEFKIQKSILNSIFSL